MNFYLILTFIILLTINKTNATQTSTLLNSKFAINQNELFDLIMKNDYNGINRIKIDKNDSATSKTSSILLNKHIKIIRNDALDFNNKQIFVENFKILFAFDGAMWLLENRNVVLLKNENSKNFNFKVDDFFSNPYNKQLMIFSDIKNKKIYKSMNGFQDYDNKILPFKPEAFYFTKDRDVLLASETTLNNLINFWLSVDFGDNWFMLKNDLTELPKLSENTIFYLDVASKNIISFNLNKFKIAPTKNNYAIESSKQVIENVTNVVDFSLIDDTLFIKSQKADGSFEIVKSQARINKRVLKRKNQILKFNDLNIKKFKLVSSTEQESLIIITHQTKDDKIKNDLFRTNDIDMIHFELSKEDIALSEIDPKLEFLSLNKRGNVYIANFMHLNEKKTFLKRSISDEWIQIAFDNYDSNDYSLDLSDNFYFAHQVSQSLISEPKLPEFMIAKATSPTKESFICVYDGFKNEWRKVLDGNFLYSIANSGRIIIAIETNKKTNEIIYSLDNGNNWLKHKFTRKLVIVDNLIKDPFEFTQTFSLFAHNAFTKANMIFKFDFSNEIDKMNNEIKFDCNQTCIDKSLFEEVCVNDKIEKDVKKCLINLKNIYVNNNNNNPINLISLIDIDFQKMSQYKIYLFYLNQYLVPVLVALALTFLVFALIVVFKSKLSYNDGQKKSRVTNKIISLIKNYKRNKQNTNINNRNDKERLISNSNNNDRSIYMLNLA